MWRRISAAMAASTSKYRHMSANGVKSVAVAMKAAKAVHQHGSVSASGGWLAVSENRRNGESSEKAGWPRRNSKAAWRLAGGRRHQ